MNADRQPTPPSTAAHLRLLLGALAVCASVLLALAAGRAEAAGSITAFDTEASTTQAGGHPDLSASIGVGRESGDINEFPRSIRIDLPPGVIGNPNVVAKCPQEAIADTSGSGTIENCPLESQVGRVTAMLDGFSEPREGAIFVAETTEDDPARLLVALQGVPTVNVEVESRTESDFGITTMTAEINSQLALNQLDLLLWGVPNSNIRGGFESCSFFGCTPVGGTLLPDPPTEWKAFTTNPTVCDEPKTTTLAMTFYEPPYPVSTATSQDPTPTNCADVPFDPSFDLQPTSTRADDATGLNVNLSLPQSTDADVIGTSHLRRAEVTLPEGVSVNPSAANGLQGCTDAQFGDGSRQPAQCPEASKVGTVEFDVPILEEPVNGSIYLGQPIGNDPQSKTMFRLFQYAEEQGLVIKIPGYAKADPQTGRLTAFFEDLPQVPFSNFNLTFKGGPRGILATPTDCGVKTTSARLTPWSGTGDVVVNSTFTVSADGAGAPCPAAFPFAPFLSSGMSSTDAGGTGTFTLNVDRGDRTQQIDRLTVDTPEGLLATLRGVPLCGDADAAAGTCPRETRIGTARTKAGAGAQPYYLPGTVSLTEGYKGAPYGLSVAVPAVAGPFDLGVVVVRQAINVDPVDASLNVVSDPIPRIVKGVPTRIRRIGVDIDRPGFMRNPTSCAAKKIRVALVSVLGATFNAANDFQVRGCSALPLRPKMSMQLTGRRQRRDGGHPGLRVALTQQPGEAGIEKARVKLPLSLALDPENANSLCEYEDGLAVKCPESSIIGNAKVETPLLNRPLEGPVYFVKGVRFGENGRRIPTLPTLLVTLRGEVAIDLRAKSSVENGKLVNTFDSPDAPFSRFNLNLRGGKGGILVVTNDASICRGRQIAKVEIDGHNGRQFDFRQRMVAPCFKGKPALRVGRVQWRGRRLIAKGRVTKKAKRQTPRKRVRVTLRCGRTNISRLARPNKAGRYRAVLRMRGSCVRAQRGRVITRYKGGFHIKKGEERRRVRRGRGLVRASWNGARLSVRGREGRRFVRQTPRRRVRVAVRCGRGKVVSRLVRPSRKSGRWKVTLRTTGRCTVARRGRLITRYKGGRRMKMGATSKAVRHRNR